ncbi:MAG TPA: ATP-binding protein [Gammaproteobacteria bacterium]|nr:ATP-binding protein [Gammaproteobacteria bacterium]
MAAQRVRRTRWGLLAMVALFVLLLVSLSFMSDATHNSERFGQLYSWLLLVNALGLVVLTALIGANLYWLVSQYRTRAAGARLTGRLVVMFVVLAVLPVSVVYYFSLQFLHRGIDSWFDVRIEKALGDSLELSRAAFDVRLRERLTLTERLADQISETPPAVAPLNLYDLRVRSGASELTLLGGNGRIIASSSVDPADIVPNRPAEEVMLQARRGQPYVGLDPVGDSGLYVRAVVPVSPETPVGEPRLLQALYRVPDRLNKLADSVQSAFARYKELAYLRKPLKYSYTLTLSLVLLLSLLSAVWAAFYSARRLVAPIRELAEGTRAVAEGDYDKQLPVSSEDELGFLVRSFNSMTRRIARARDQARRSQQQVEGQRAYLETVLGSLSSGVMSLSRDLKLRTVNGAASHILGVDLRDSLGEGLAGLKQHHPFLDAFLDSAALHAHAGDREWHEEIALFGARGRQVLLCRGTALPGEGVRPGGMVLVFDDVTALIQAQRDAAWGEVARRLAHEIKNPLTPIQLSAERLRHKYLANSTLKDAEVLDRATHTIVQQVEAMKEMVNAFTEYARAPQIQRRPVELNALILEVLELYRDHVPGLHIESELDGHNPRVEADAGRLRQLLHNLFKNAQEATAGQPDARVQVATRCVDELHSGYVELSVQDNGPGFPDGLLDQLFEPYVTTKARGTGLGLAIVKKIVEEHGGVIEARNLRPTGARIRIRLRTIEPQERLPVPAGGQDAGSSV